MNVFMIVVGTFFAAWMLTNLIFSKLLRSNNLTPTALFAAGLALIVWGIIG
jgi:hypothetical protein